MTPLLLLLLAVEPDLPKAKDFEAKDLAGATVRLEDLKGKVVLLNFWGIWCKSCRQEIPHLSALDREWRKKGLVVLGADYGDAPEDLRPFVKELEMSYPVLIDDGLADEYEVLVYPTSVVIDREGLVRGRGEGYREESFEDMKALVKLLLEEVALGTSHPYDPRSHSFLSLNSEALTEKTFSPVILFPSFAFSAPPDTVFLEELTWTERSGSPHRRKDHGHRHSQR
jgi:thiol-disulfide isomerase/thioredoxin